MTKVPEYLCIDFETASHCDIRNGSAAYAEHPTTRALCAVFTKVEIDGAKEGENVECLVKTTRYNWLPAEPVPDDVVRWVRQGGAIVAHNVSFEHEIIKAGHIPNLPIPAVSQWHDTMAMAAYLNLPQSLDGLSQALGVTTTKDMEGHKLMMKLCKLDEQGRHIHPVTRADISRLLQYCEVDVMTTIQCYNAMPPMIDSERRAWIADANMNERGAFVDVQFTDNIAHLAHQRAVELDRVATEESATVMVKAADKKLASIIKASGHELPKRKRANGTITASLDADACDELLALDGLPGVVRDLLNARRESGRLTSLSKLKALPRMRSKDERVRWQVRFCGASQTGRWAAKGLQLHNTPKDRRKKSHTKLVRTIIESRDYHMLKSTEPNVLEALSLCLRSMVVAPPGHDLIAADYSAIEARVLPWLCFFDSKLQLFRDGVDTYVRAAEKVGSTNRSYGKVQELALGYGMGVPKFAETATSWGVPITLKEARRGQKIWREDNKPIKDFWAEMALTAKELIEGKPDRAAPVGRLTLRRTGDRFIIELPSGRFLSYWMPRIVQQVRTFDYVTEDGTLESDESEIDVIQFWGPGKRGAMELKDTYGGKLVENATQAAARDLLACALVAVEGHPVYTPVLHMHDSLAAQVPTGAGSVEEFEELMTNMPAWADGLPIAAEGYRARYYQG